jgi:hypothetical protein
MLLSSDPFPSSALFIRLIIRTFELVFSAGIVFFSHNKSANSVFQPTYQQSQQWFSLTRSHSQLIMHAFKLERYPFKQVAIKPQSQMQDPF